MKKFILTILGIIIFCGLFAQDMQQKSSQDRTVENCVQIADGGSGNFTIENGKLYRLTIKSCWMSADARIGTYLIYGLNIADVGAPYVLTIAESSSIDWSFNYSLIGSYDANMVITSNGWGDQGLLAIFEYFDCNPNAIDGLKTKDLIKIYPNPANHQIQIVCENIESATLNVYNIQGKFVFSKKLNNSNTTIDVTNFSNGIYLFKIIDEDGNILKTEKIVKE